MSEPVGQERKRCIFCQREIATDADWETNGNLSAEHEDEEAERLGLDSLCWEPEDDSCVATARRIGRPTTLAEALERFDRWDGAGLRVFARHLELVRVVAEMRMEAPSGTFPREQLERLQEMLEKANGESLPDLLTNDEVVEAAGAAAMEKHHFRPYDETTRTMLKAAATTLQERGTDAG